MPFQDAIILGGVPAAFMLASTYIGLGIQVPDNIEGALQHFAAGVLLCTVGTELLPEIVNATGWAQNIAAFFGFFLGVAVLILLGLFSPANAFVEEEEEEEGKSPGTTVEAPSITNDDAEEEDERKRRDFYFDSQRGDTDSLEGGSFFKCSPTPLQQQHLREIQFMIVGRRYRQRHNLRSTAGRLEMKRSMSLSSLPLVAEDQPLLTSSTRNNINDSYTEEAPQESNGPSKEIDTKEKKADKAEGKMFPLAFVIAVAIDSSLDGLLIGIASVAGPSAGPMMSASLSVEMSFLGLSLATTLQGQKSPKGELAAIVGPTCLVLAAGLGGAMATTLSHSPVLSAGMISFGASALLFMVAEELLLDAHESGEHVWWVDLQLYTGFFASIIAGKFVK